MSKRNITKFQKLKDVNLQIKRAYRGHSTIIFKTRKLQIQRKREDPKIFGKKKADCPYNDQESEWHSNI